MKRYKVRLKERCIKMKKTSKAGIRMKTKGLRTDWKKGVKLHKRKE